MIDEKDLLEKVEAGAENWAANALHAVSCTHTDKVDIYVHSKKIADLLSVWSNSMSGCRMCRNLVSLEALAQNIIVLLTNLADTYPCMDDDEIYSIYNSLCASMYTELVDQLKVRVTGVAGHA